MILIHGGDKEKPYPVEVDEKSLSSGFAFGDKGTSS